MTFDGIEIHGGVAVLLFFAALAFATLRRR